MWQRSVQNKFWIFLVFNQSNIFTNHNIEIKLKGLTELELSEEVGWEWSLSKKIVAKQMWELKKNIIEEFAQTQDD